MKTVTAKAPAKINWYLNVLGKRSDGYHDIETVMQTVDIFDTLTFSKTDARDIRISISNNIYNIACGEDNLVYKAAKLLGVYGVDIHIDKTIPAQAGLGGGSSDAACTLKTLNDMFELGFSQAQLALMAVRLGADVPFFIYGGACMASGIGEIITPLEPVTDFGFKIVKPFGGLSTGHIYSLIDRAEKTEAPTMDEFLKHFKNNDKELTKLMFNAMEAVSEAECPQIANVKRRLLSEGCEAAMMSGSGSAVFGLARGNVAKKLCNGKNAVIEYCDNI